MTEISFAGHIQAKDIAPYVYFIKRGYLLYIGETQKNPIIRWSDHLSETGSFRNAILRVDDEVLTKNFSTNFYAYRCGVIEAYVQNVEYKRATQFIEHELHSRIMCWGIPSEIDIKVISNTIRTAPLGYNYEWLTQYVNLIYERFICDLTNASCSEDT
jgi:hypothetical protein